MKQIKSARQSLAQVSVHDAYLGRPSPTGLRGPLRGRRGRLTRLPDLPLDILFEVFAHLHPLDLLRLARAWKKMRAFLMSRNSRWIWRQALSSVEGLPNCPPSMSEPEYTNLMFSSLCHYCGNERAPTIVWITRNRSCGRCFPHHYQRATKLRQSGAFSTLPKEYWEFAQLTGKIVHNTSFAPITSRDTRQTIVSLDLLQVLSEQHAIAKRHQQDLELWLNKTRLDHATWTDITDALAGWHHDQGVKRSEELAAARERRLGAVVRNLNAAGYGEILEKMDLGLLRQHKLVRKSEDLTERVWANLKPKLSDFMVQVGARLREEHRLDQITRRRRLFAKYISDHCPPRYTMSVPITELSQAWPIKSIIELSPVDQVVTFNDFPPPHVISILSSFWHRQRRLNLVQIMRKSVLVSRAASVAHLDLATTFFCCAPEFKEPIGQQDILIHPSTFSRRPDRTYGSNLVARLFEDLQQEFWNFGGDRIIFHESAFLIARSIITACGHDPNTTTAATMDGLSLLLECTSCKCSSDGRLVMPWRRAVMHAIDHMSFSRHQPTKWVRLDTSDPFHSTAVAHILGQEPFFRCHLCHAYGDATSITKHIRERHTLFQTVTVMRQPHLPVRIPRNIGLPECDNGVRCSIGRPLYYEYHAFQ